MNAKFTATFPLLALIIIMSAPLAMAQGAPCIPNRFYGTATVNGGPAPTGLEITARFGATDAASVIAVSGKYGYYPYTFDVPDPDGNCENAHTVSFFIKGQPAGSATFINGQFTKLDLSATGVVLCGDGSCNYGETCSTCSQDCGACPSGDTGDSGSSGGGGGGGGSSVRQTATCTPDWECSSWGQCLDGSQTRTCLDVNSCSVESDRPEEIRDCGIESVLPENCTEGQAVCVGNDLFSCDVGSKWHEAESCELGCLNGACVTEEPVARESGFNPFTGAFLNSSTAMLGLIALIVLLALAYILWRRRGKAGKK
jgi:hypothetical protein